MAYPQFYDLTQCESYSSSHLWVDYGGRASPPTGSATAPVVHNTTSPLAGQAAAPAVRSHYAAAPEAGHEIASGVRHRSAPAIGFAYTQTVRYAAAPATGYAAATVAVCCTAALATVMRSHWKLALCLQGSW